MREIDERVVEMRFKNSNFEKNAKHTIGVLDELEKKIAFPKAKKNIEGLEKEFSKISFGALEKGIETVTLKFSALQIAGITAIQNITNKAINAGEALVKSLSIDQITAGFTKYEQKTTSVQTIVSATGKTVEEVNRALNKLNWFTDETSYNFVDMVNNIGKFTAAGVDLEDAMSAMIGIANEAAVSGQNASAASHAMMNFSQALGSGAVKLQDWKSIQTVNMDTIEFKQTIIDTAVAMGTLEKTAEDTYKVVGEKDKFVDAINFTNELKTGWFTSDVLVESLKKYSDYAEQIYEITQKEGISASEAMERFSNDIETLGEKAFKAGQVSKTFTDAVEATKDAVSTQWMKTFELIVGDLDQASETWTELTSFLWDFFAQDLETMNADLAPVLTSNYKQLVETLKEAGISEEALGDAMIKTGKKHGLAFDKVIESFGSLEAVLTKGGYTNILTEALDDMTNGAEVASTKVVDLTDKMEEYNKVVMDVIRGDYKNGVEARTKALAEAGYEFSVIQPLVNRYLEKGTLTVEDYKEVLGELTEEEIANIKITGKQADELKELANKLKKPSGRELIIDSFRNALKGIQKVILTAKEAWNEIFPPKTQEEIYGIIEKFHDFSQNLVLNEENADKLKRSLKGVFAVLDIVKQVIGGAFKSGLTILGKLFGKTGLDVSELSASLGDNLVVFRDWLNEGNKIGVFFETLTYHILNAKKYITDWANSFLESHPKISKWFDGLLVSIDKFKTSVKGKWDKLVENLKNGDIKGALETVATYFLEFRDTVMSYITGIDFSSLTKETNTAGFGKAKNILEDLKGTFLGVVEGIKNAAITAGGWVKTFINSLNPMWFIPVMFASAIIAIHEISKELAAMTKLLRPLEDIKKAFISTLDSIGKSVNKFFKAKTLTEKSKAIINFSVAIGILAGSIWVLSKVEGSIWPAVGAIAALAAILVIANNVVGKWGKQGKGLARLTGFAQSLGVCMLLIAAAFKILETIDTNKIGLIALEITGIFGNLILALVVISNMPTELPKMTGILIGLSVVIGLISSNFLILSLVPTEGLLTKVISIGLVLAELLGVIAIMSVIQKKWKTAAKRTTSSLIGVVIALDLLVVSLKLIETVKLKDILNNLGSFIAVFVMLDVLAKISSKVGAGTGGTQILALAAGLLILVPAINSFSDIKLWGLVKACIVVGALLKLEQMIINSSFASGQNSVKAGAMVLMVSAAVAALALVVWGFSALDLGGLAQGTIAVGIIMWIITQMIYASEKAEGGMGKMIALTAMVAIVGGYVVVLANMDTDKALKASASLSLVFLSVIGAMKLLEKSDGISWKSMGQMAILAIVGFPLIANILEALNEMKTEGVIERATALSVALLALSAASVILVKFGKTQNDKDLIGVWKTLGVLSVVLIELAIIGGVLNHFKVDPKTMFGQFAALSAGILMLEVCTLGMIGLAKVVEAAGGATSILPALGEVAKIVGIIGLIGMALAMVFGGIQELTEMYGEYDMNTTLEKGVKTMTLIGNSVGSIIGGFVGGIVGGIGEATLSHMEQMGTYLSAFAESVEPFLDKMADIKPEVGTNISTLTSAILDLTKAEFIQGITDFGNFIASPHNPINTVLGVKETPFDNLSRGLISFARAVEKVADIFAEMEERKVIDDLNVAIDVSTKMVDLLNAIPKQSVFGDFFKGDISWTNLSDGLVAYGEAVFEYSDWVILITEARQNAIERSIPVAEDLNDLLGKLEPSAGLIEGVFGGAQKWRTLSEGLPTFGNALASYAGWVKDMTDNDWKAIENSITPAEKLNDLLGKLKPTKSKISQVFVEGDTEWSTLSEGLEDVGTALLTFGTLMSYFESTTGWGSVERAVPMLEKFVDSANELTNMSGLAYLKDTVDMAASDLGEGVSNFASKFTPDMRDKADVGIRICDQLIELSLAIKENDIIGKGYLQDLGKDVNNYAQNMAAAAKTLRSIDNEDFYEIAKYVISGYSNGIYTGQAIVKESVAKSMVDTTLHTLESGLEINSPSWKTFVDGLFTAEGFGGGLEQGRKYITDAVSGWGQEVLNGINLDSILNQFSEFGVDLTNVIPDLNSLGIDFGTDLTFDYEQKIASMKEEISALTKEWGKSSEQVINAQLELDELQDEYKAYTKSRTSNLEYYENKEYEEAQKQFDKLLEDYKAGRKTQMEFDTEYTQLLQKNTVKQAELFQYSAQKIQEYVSDSLEKVQDKFETKIADIQSKMDSTTDSWNKSFDEEFKFTTNQDLFDEEISKYDKQIEQLNTQIEKEKRLHGEDSIVVQKLQKDLERVQNTREEINEQWNEYDEDYKNQIVSVDMTGEWDKQAEQARKSLEAVDSLKGRLSEDMIDWLGTLDPEKLYAVATDWAGKTDSELQVIMDKYHNMKVANQELSESLYSPEIQAAEEEFVYDFGNTLNTLPDTAKAIGASIVQNMTNSFSEETNKTLQTFKESGDNLIFAIKEGLGFVEGNSKSTKMEETGEDMSNSIGDGFANNQAMLVEVFADTLGNSLYEAVGDVDYDGIAQYLGNGLYEALGNIDADSSILVSPVLGSSTNSAFNAKRTLNSGRSVTIARETGASFNQRYETKDNNKPETTESPRGSTSFTQNIYSPDPVNRSTIRRDTKQLFQLANSKFK